MNRTFLKPIAKSMLLLISAVFVAASQVPSITSFTPTSGRSGTLVTISGTNFSAVPANDIVYFGAVRGSVISASATQLTVSVPLGSSFAPIAATVNGLTGYSSSPFIVTFSGGAALSSASYLPKSDFAASTLPYGAAASDLDGDGKPDIVVANYTSGTISVYRNIGVNDSSGASVFAAAVEFAAGSNPWGVAIGDLDGDGKLDIAVSNGPGSTVSVLWNTSVAGTIDAGSFAAKVSFPTGGSGYGIAIADLDGDGKPDIVATNRFGSSFSVLRNVGAIGAIAFAANIDFPTGANTNPYGVAVGDLDGDGKLDLVVANSAEDTLSVFRNTSIAGTIDLASFAPGVGIPVTGTPIAVAVADVNGDGKSDIISVNTSDSTVSVFQNQSSIGNITNASFAAGVDFKLSSAPTSIAIADLNGDARPDIVVANENSNKLSIFQNAATAAGSISITSFGSEVDLATATGPFGLAVDDLNGDGRPDLVSANSGSNSVSVFGSIVGAPSISLSTTSLDFGIVALRDSSSQNLVIRDLSADTLIVDSVYSNRKELRFSATHGISVGTLSFAILLKGDTLGLYSDTVFIRTNSQTPLLKVPVSSRIYARPGKPVAVSVNPSSWSNAASFTISWTNQAGTLPVSRVVYSIDTLPRSGPVLRGIAASGSSASFPITQVGRDTVYFFIEDSLGNSSLDSIGTAIVLFDNHGPTLVQNNANLDTVFVQADGTLSAIPAIASTATEPANESGVETFQLLYRRLDEQAWTTANFSNDTLTIPAASFVRNGVVVGAEYIIQAADSAGNSTSSGLLSFDVRFKTNLTVNVFSTRPSIHSLNLPAGQEAKAYRLFSAPYDPEDERPGSLIDPSFGPHAVKGVPYVNWRMERLLNGAWSDYDSFKDSSILVPGAGFFMVSENQGGAGSLVKPELVRADRMLYTGIRLNAGWNLVGDPFLVDVPFDHLIFQGGTPQAHYYYSGNGTQGGWEGSGPDFDTLRSWQGMAIKMDSSSVLKFNLTGIQLPQAPRQAKGAKTGKDISRSREESKGWTLQVDASRDDIGMSCLGTEIGMKPDAVKGIDESDRFQAPFVGSRNLLVSTENSSGLLMKDMRPLSADGDIWDLTVMTGDANANAKLSFGTLDEISNIGFEATLLDAAKGLAYDLKKQNNISVTTGKDGVGRYRIIVGTASYIERNMEGIALIPTAPNLYNNYPNPFNPATIIRYAVPNTLKSALVQLKVYNVLGQEVRSLVNETNLPGFYEISFDGKDLSSGTYFYRISITGGGVAYRETRKMLLIK